MRPWLPVTVLLVAAVGTAGLVYARARTASMEAELAIQASRARPAPPPQVTDRLSGSRLVRFPEDVCVVVGASLLSPVTLLDGTVRRCVWTNAVFTRGGIAVGESQYHSMLPTDSTETVDLSIATVELAPELPTKSYHVTITPRSPKTWGTVATFDDDLIVEASL